MRVAAILVGLYVAAIGRPEGLQPRTTAQRGAPPIATVQFENAAAAAGIDFTHVSGASPARHLYEIMSGGGLFLDYDNDGWQDALLVDGGSLIDPAVARRARHRLFRNRGNGTFEDVTARSGLTHSEYGMGGCAAKGRGDRVERAGHQPSTSKSAPRSSSPSAISGRPISAVGSFVSMRAIKAIPRPSAFALPAQS